MFGAVRRLSNLAASAAPTALTSDSIDGSAIAMMIGGSAVLLLVVAVIGIEAERHAAAMRCSQFELERL